MDLQPTWKKRLTYLIGLNDKEIEEKVTGLVKTGV